MEAALEIKKELLSDNIHVFSTGVRVRLHPVAPFLIDLVSKKIKAPKPPKVQIDGDRWEENPNDPDYLQAMSEFSSLQSNAIMDALIEFGVELVEAIPTGWERKIKKWIDFDESDQDTREFYYKKYMALGANDVATVQKLAGFTQEGVAEAEAAF